MSHTVEHLLGFYIQFLLLQRQFTFFGQQKFLETFQCIYEPGNDENSQKSIFDLKLMKLLTFKPHDSIFTTFEQQLIYNKEGGDGLRGCGVDFWVVVLQRQNDTSK